MQSIEHSILLIDAGNTRVKGALYRNGQIVPVFSFETAEVLKRGELPSINASDVAVASVVPGATEIIRRIYPGALFISQKLKLPFKLSYKGNLGADRIASIAGGLKYSNSFIVVNCGTATVIDVVVKKEFIGGYILPGVKTMAESLFKKGALLPEVEVELQELPGNSTEECIKAGITAATTGAINKVKERFKLPLFITGGYGKPISEIVEGKLLENLTFEGIYEIYKLVRGELPP